VVGRKNGGLRIRGLRGHGRTIRPGMGTQEFAEFLPPLFVFGISGMGYYDENDHPDYPGGQVSLCDRWIGWFLDEIQVIGLYDNSLIIFAKTKRGNSN